jgi:aspartokinase/homoserine dehydrogenase 1
MKVLKFGGTSVGSAAAVKQLLDIVREQYGKESLLVVVSAMSGITDQLIACGTLAANGEETYKDTCRAIEHRHLEAVQQLLPVQNQSGTLSLVKRQCNSIEDLCNGIFLLREFSAKTRDQLISYGELISSQIIAAALLAEGLPATWKDARELIVTDSGHGNALVNFTETNQRFHAFLQPGEAELLVLPGFIAANEQQVTTTLGRGGSDYTAAIAAAAVNASVLEIWTDVSGMMTADPRWVTNVKIIPAISYQEAMELSHFGAKVIYPPTIQPVMNKNIPVYIRNTFAPAGEGTVIRSAVQTTGMIRGISSISNIALLSLEGSGMVGVPGFSRRLFEALSNEQINVVLITQGSSEHSICVGVQTSDADKARRAVDHIFAHEIALQRVLPLQVEKDLSIVALVGENMKSHQGISGKMFDALGRNGINIRAIAQGSSERNISAVIATKDVRKAVNVLHEAFFETTYKQLNLFLAGAGNVGSRLLEQFRKQQAYLKEHLHIQLNVVGIANSRQALMVEEGIDLRHWQEQLAAAPDCNIHEYITNIIQRNLRNTVFADVTANADVAGVYDRLLEKSIAVVACNKVACSGSYGYYRQLKSLSKEYNAPFLFETNVGAGLPVISTLNDLIKSGDNILRIQAVLSGTLNFVFNNYNGSRPFAEVVRQAQAEGYTEPDPRLDLSGKDVMRKVMILAREAGNQLEMEDIDNVSFMPDACMQGSVEDFYQSMLQHETHFRKLYDEAAAKGCKLKFVASYNEGKAAVGLQHVPADHNLYHLYGKDNIVLFYTERYQDQPMVVKGAGAGAEVTASGVFADVVRTARV